MGQKRKSRITILMSVNPPKAEVARRRCHFRDVPTPDVDADKSTMLGWLFLDNRFWILDYDNIRPATPTAVIPLDQKPSMH